MGKTPESLVLEAFQRAATRVPAYKTVLAEAGVQITAITSLLEFAQLPVLQKRDTFQRFPIEQLCVDGQLTRLAAVLTSSGHSGVFAFGLTEADAANAAAEWVDDLLDALFAVRSRPTLLINCLPMGVKVHTRACTLAETSVRSDMAVGLVQTFAPHFEQIILVGEAAFIKRLLELGRRAGINWQSHLVQIILGEEPLAENARKYIEALLGIDPRRPERGLVASSMGVAEVGLNLFFDVPPVAPLILLRRTLHENKSLREALFGPVAWVPSLFTYDPRRIFVEFDHDERLILTTLDPQLRIPLVRYATGDRGNLFRLPSQLRSAVEEKGISWQALESIPIVAIRGRGDHALAGKIPVYPEAVKEGVYREPALVELTTANFRIVSGAERARVRIQLSPGVAPDPKLDEKFHTAIAHYVQAPFEVTCEAYESFGSGMELDYERKFAYLEP